MATFDFQKEVLEKSFETPVLVDFWAPWCGPCRVLGPVLEELANEQAPRWELVKINTEEEEELAYQYHIQSIPNVKLFSGGDVVAEFAGALPKTHILKWLDQHLPDDRKNTLKMILSRMEGGDQQAIAELGGFVEENPGMPEARLTLAQYTVFKDPAAIEPLLEHIHAGDPSYEKAEDLRAIARFLTSDFDPDQQAGALLEQARLDTRSGNYESGIQKIIEAVSVNREYNAGLPRRAAIAFFRTWGPDHPLTKNYRWRFDMALY